MGASDVDVHTKMTPLAFLVERLFMDPLMGRGPNRSTAVDQNGGIGPIRCSGRGAIFCSPNFLAHLGGQGEKENPCPPPQNAKV